MSIRVVCRDTCTSLRTAAGSAITILLALGPIGCAGADNPDRGNAHRFEAADSAGITLLITRGTDVFRPLGWAVDSMPDIVLGSTKATYLYRVQGIAATEHGGILVVNAGSQQIRLFGADGTMLSEKGADGEGPGEFRDPVLVPWIGTDSTLIFDTRIPRLQIFSADGMYQWSLSFVNGWPAGRTPPLAALDLTSLVFARRGIVGGELSFRSDGLRQSTRHYFWYDTRTANEIPIDSFVLDLSYQSDGEEAAIPFSPRPATAASSDGLLLTDGRTFDIRLYDRQSTLRRIMRVDRARRPVTTEMLADVQSKQWPRGMPLPDTVPAFQALQLDSEGWLWAQLFHWQDNMPRQWLLFDDRGEARGLVETPAGLEVAAIGADFILGLVRDNLGVEYVRRYRLTRTPRSQ